MEQSFDRPTEVDDPWAVTDQLRQEVHRGSPHLTPLLVRLTGQARTTLTISLQQVRDFLAGLDWYGRCAYDGSVLWSLVTEIEGNWQCLSRWRARRP
jgi:hypothetical protein